MLLPAAPPGHTWRSTRQLQADEQHHGGGGRPRPAWGRGGATRRTTGAARRHLPRSALERAAAGDAAAGVVGDQQLAVVREGAGEEGRQQALDVGAAEHGAGDLGRHPEPLADALEGGVGARVVEAFGFLADGGAGALDQLVVRDAG